MTRLPSSFAVVLFVASSACGGGGGGGVAEPPRQDVVVDVGQQSTRRSAIVGFDAAGPAFVAGAVYDGSWSANGVLYSPGRWVAVTTSRLATVTPATLPPGDYEVEIAFALGRARGRATVASTPWNPNPGGDAIQLANEFATRIAALRSDAASLREPALTAALLADLDRLELVRQAFLLVGPASSPAEQDAFQVTMNATPQLGAPAVAIATVGPLADLQSMRQRIVGEVEAWRLAAGAVAIGGRVGRDLGFADGGELLSPGLVLAGGVRMVAALLDVATTYDRLFTATEGATLQVVEALPAAASGDTAPTPLSWLAAGSSRALAAQVSLRSLVAADRQFVDERVQGLFAAVDLALATQSALFGAIGEVVATPFPPPPVAPRVSLQTVPGSLLTIDAQSNPLLQLVLLDGRLAVAGGAENLPASSAVTFGLATNGLVSTTQTLSGLDVLAMREGMLPIEPGTYQRGSGGQIQDLPWTVVETPVASVTLARPFWIGRCEVTQAEFAAMTGLNPSTFVGDQRPVENVTWPQAVAFCEARTASEAAAGRLPPGYAYRLPTEAEWEYCARAGNQAEWSFGFPPSCSVANFAPAGAPCLAPAATRVVASYAPNAWGLHDTAGNVLEWCADAWNGLAGYPAGAATDPFVATGPLRVVRGGGFLSDTIALRSAHRAAAAPLDQLQVLGFRVVCAPAL